MLDTTTISLYGSHVMIYHKKNTKLYAKKFEMGKYCSAKLIWLGNYNFV